MKKGQIALIVLVVSAVVLTVGMSLSKKTVVETKITTDEELLKQAFNAAESGIDYYLGTGKTDFTAPDSKSGAKVSVNKIGGSSNIINLGGLTLQNHNNFTWMIAHKDDGSLDFTAPDMSGFTDLTICVNNGFSGSLKVDYFYLETAVYKVYRTGFNVGANNTVTGFSNVSPANDTCPSISGMKVVPVGSIPLSGKPLLLVVRPIADDTKVAVAVTGVNFPSQGSEISSKGESGDVAGGAVNRVVNVVNQYQVPSFMLEAVTSSGNVLSN